MFSKAHVASEMPRQKFTETIQHVEAAGRALMLRRKKNPDFSSN